MAGERDNHGRRQRMALLDRAGEPEQVRPEQHDFAGSRVILFFFRSRSRITLKKLEWSRSWSRSWHKLVWLQAPTVFKNFVKSNVLNIIL